LFHPIPPDFKENRTVPEAASITVSSPHLLGSPSWLGFWIHGWIGKGWRGRRRMVKRDAHSIGGLFHTAGSEPNFSLTSVNLSTESKPGWRLL